MTLDEAKRIVDLLADGVDPETGQILPEGHLLHHCECRRALSVLLNSVDGPSVKPACHTSPSRLDHLGRIEVS